MKNGIKQKILKFGLLIGTITGIVHTQEVCEPVYTTEKNIISFSAGQHLEADPSCTGINNCQDSFIMVGQPILNTEVQYTDENGDVEIDLDWSENVKAYSSEISSSDFINSFGFFNDYIAQPQPPIVRASDGDFQDKILVTWDYLGCHVEQTDCISMAPSITSDEITLYRNGYILTTLPFEQQEYQDFNVFPGMDYVYGVTVENDFGTSHTDDDGGFLNPNGIIAGKVETNSGNPVQDTKVMLTPNLGRSAFFDGTSYIYYYDEAINNNKQFNGLDSAYTIETWFRSVHSQEQVIFSGVDSSTTNSYIDLRLTSEGYLKWTHSTSAGVGESTITTHYSYTDAEEGDWHHVACVFDGSEMIMYVDGMMAGTNDANGYVDDNMEIVLGKSSSRDYLHYFYGRLDDFRIWNYPREWEDIRRYMDITLSGEEEGLEAYWKFDEVEGNIIFDLTEKDVDGETCSVGRDDYMAPVFVGDITDSLGNYLIKGIYYDDGTDFTVTPSKSTSIGRSLEFDGEDSYVSFENQRIDITGEFTIEGWFKTKSNTNQTILWVSNPANNYDERLVVRVTYEGNFKVNYLDNTLTYEGELADELWHHWAVSFDESNVEIYLDGNSIGTVNIGEESITDLSEIVIGRRAGHLDRYFNGRLDEMRVWDYARSSDQISGTMLQSLEGDEFGLIHYWRMNEGIDDIITDGTGNMLAGTLQSDVAWSKDIPTPEIFEHYYDPESRQAILNTQNTVVDQVNFTDISMIPISGYVLFENTTCFEEGVEILVNGESLIPPIYTDENGKFTIELEPGNSGSIIEPVFSDHEFVPQFIELPLISSPMTGIYFSDKQTFDVTGKVAGGDCYKAITPSQSSISVTLSAVNGCFEKIVEVASDSINFNHESIPPLIYNISVSHPDPNIEFTADTLDVTSANREQEFIYYADPQVEFVDIPTDSEDCDDFPIQFTQREPYWVTYELFEEYGDQKCLIDSFEISIDDNITGNSYNMDSRDFEGEGTPGFQVVPRFINTADGGSNPFQKKVEITLTDEKNRNASAIFWAFIEGVERTEGATFSTTTSQYPWYVLRVPPGDESEMYFTTENEMCNSSITTVSDEESVGNSFNISNGINIEVQTCGGFGVMVCKKVVDIGITSDVGGNFENTEISTSIDEKTSCLTTSQDFIAGGDGLITGEDATVFIGGGKTIEIGVANDLIMEDCEPTLTSTIIQDNHGVNSTYVHSRYYINNVLIPTLEDMVEQNVNDTDAVASIEFWNNDVLLKDSIAVANALPDSVFQIGEAEETESSTISFDAGATIGFEYTSSSISSREESYEIVDLNEFVGSWGIEAFGQGVTYEHVDTEIYSNNETSIDEEIFNKTFGFSVGDDDPGDGFAFTIKRDPYFGFPVFDLIGGQSSCPWQEGTFKRHKAELTVAQNNILDLPPDETAVFTVNLINNSETQEANYYRLVSEMTTQNGATVKVNGQVLGGDGQYFWLEPNVATPVFVEVERGPVYYDYQGIALELHAPCEGDIAADLGAPTQNAGSALLNVTFLEPCSEVSITNLEDNWLVTSDNEDDIVSVTVSDYDRFDENLISIDLQYRTDVGGDWFNSYSVPVGDLDDDYVIIPFNISPDIINDGGYEIRARAVCEVGTYSGSSQSLTGTIDRTGPEVFGIPQPVDGILGQDDLIQIDFNEELDCESIIDGSDILLFNTVTGAQIDVEYTCGENTITLEFGVINKFVENMTVRAEIQNLYDKYGNSIPESISWEFYVNRNPIEWNGTGIENIVIWEDEEFSTSRQLENTGGSNRSYEIIGGREGAVVSGDALDLPTWIDISPLEGTLTPGSIQEISIGLAEGLDFGHFQTTIYASGTMGDEPMMVDIRKLCYEPDWSVNPPDYQYTMNITATLMTEGEQSMDEYDMIGAFINDEMRGVARLTYMPSLDGILTVEPYEIFLTVYSNVESGEEIEFRVWDSSECSELGHIEEDFTFASNTVIGSLSSPTTITATSQIISNITFPEGYSWFSVNITNEDMSLNSIFGNIEVNTDDIIKDQTSFSQYVEGYGWVGTLNEIDPQSMYLIQLQNSNALEVVGYPVNVELDTIQISTGWNWIGYTPQYSMPLNDALESVNSFSGDIIKNQYGYAQFLEGFGWFGSMAYLQPKQGYMLKSSNPGELLYPFEMDRNMQTIPIIPENPIAQNAPDWNVNINQFEHSMTMTAIGQVNGSPLNDELDMLAAFVLVETEDGLMEECRGVSQPIYIEALDQYIAFLMVYGNIQGEEIFYKMFDADLNNIWSVYESTEFTSNAIVGELYEPFSLNAQPPIGDVTFDGLLNVQDILLTVNFILDFEIPTVTESIVADLNGDNAINVADIVEMIAIILDSPLVKIENDITVELRIQGNEVSIFSENHVSGIQFNLFGSSEIKSNYDMFTNPKNGELKTVIVNLDGNHIQDGYLFQFSENEIEFSDLIIVGRNGEILDYEVRYIPIDFSLSQNYPNPFNPETTIKFDLPEDSKVIIRVYDVNGRLVDEILNLTLQAGYHQLHWNALDKSGIPLANGIYFYQMTTSDFSDVKKMLLIK